MKKHFTALMITLVLILTAGAVQAALVTESFSGTITYAADDNLFGVAADDTFSWSTTYDLDYLDSGYLVIGDSEEMALSVTIGSRNFVETEDYFYGAGIFGAPLLYFDEGESITGINLLVDDYDNSYRFRSDSDGLAFEIWSLSSEDNFTDDVLLASGAFAFNPVPVPAAAWLLGSGLLGLVGLRRRKA